MKELEKDIALGTSPCKKAGHTLKTRAGHCIQCDPARIAFQRRHSQSGWIYVAGSLSKRLIKIGMTSDVQKRESTLRSQQYGGSSDWKVIYSAKLEKNSGQAEFEIHSILQNYFFPAAFIKSGKQISCYEIFNCNYETAKKAVDEVLTKYKVNDCIHIDDFQNYNFENKKEISLMQGAPKKKSKIKSPKENEVSAELINAKTELPRKYMPNSIPSMPRKKSSDYRLLDIQKKENLHGEDEQGEKDIDFGLIIFLATFALILIKFILR